ncbi:DUF882 domain-containing protein [Bradyrhizobium sp. STM 3557]|uniref:DUF882 domain-containing protein n=1 Tax=Bradyrhizobium sp. STM 3557 TaxID=578920 RepID=UPI00388E4FE1
MGAGSVHDASASNETRTLSFHHTHSGEDLTITFKRDGRYDENALKQLNHYLRDWRTQDETVMDRHLFDILWEVYRDVEAKQPIQIVSSYRSPGTNAMLRHRSAHSGVARHSQHMLGHAMDFYIPGVPLEQIRFAGLRLQRGGVGFYPTSGSPFVHLDTGNIRHWPRMTHDQLAKVFPDGRTVHIPSDGVPLKGYELARAEIEKRGNGDDAATVSMPSLLARLFRGKPSEDDDEGAAESEAKSEAKPIQVASVSAAKSNDTRSSDKADKPSGARGKLASALQLASADSQLVQKPKQAPDAAGKAEPAMPAPSAGPQSVADIINARGFWGDNPATPKQATPEQVAAITARRAATSDPQPTGSTSVMNAMAFVPLASSPADRANAGAASAPVPQQRSRSSSRSATSTSEADATETRGAQTQDGLVTASRVSIAKDSDAIWIRAMMLAPSASRAMSVTMLGDADLSVMRSFFVKPQSAIAISFSGDATPGLTYDQFTGPAAIKLETRTFVMRAAALR